MELFYVDVSKIRTDLHHLIDKETIANALVFVKIDNRTRHLQTINESEIPIQTFCYL